MAWVYSLCGKEARATTASIANGLNMWQHAKRMVRLRFKGSLVPELSVSGLSGTFIRTAEEISVSLVIRTAVPSYENAKNIMLFRYVVTLVRVAYRFKG